MFLDLTQLFHQYEFNDKNSHPISINMNDLTRIIREYTFCFSNGNTNTLTMRFLTQELVVFKYAVR